MHSTSRYIIKYSQVNVLALLSSTTHKAVFLLLVISKSWKWVERSKIHREKFKKLREHAKEHPEEIQEVNGVRVCCSQEFLIANGSEGTTVYVGLGRDGVERAVKRLVRGACSGEAEHEKDVLNELNTMKSPFVVN